jgi:hypothetical protein
MRHLWLIIGTKISRTAISFMEKGAHRGRGAGPKVEVGLTATSTIHTVAEKDAGGG